MKNILLKMLMAMGLVASLAACQGKDDNNYYYGEFQSCVDFGGGCNYHVFNEFQSQYLMRYPTDQAGRPEGATQQNAGGVVYYSSLDACSRMNSQTVYSYSGENMNRWIPVELPRDGGLACLDSLVLDTSGVNPNQGWGNSYDTNLMLFSEFAMYGYTPSSWSNNTPIGGNLVTKYLNLIPGQNTNTTNNQASWGNLYNSFSQTKSMAASVRIPVMCNLRHGDNAPNDDCRGRTCQRISNNYLHTGQYLGVCTY